MPDDKFVIYEIKKAVPAASRPAGVEASPKSQQASLNAIAPALSLTARKAGGWLARIVKRKSEIGPPTPPTTVPKDEASNTTSPVATYNAEEYNWNGFFCPIVTLPVLPLVGAGILLAMERPSRGTVAAFIDASAATQDLLGGQ